jgi:hypothetical protein
MAFLKTESPEPLHVTQGILDPLSYPVFGALCAVSFASNIGTWVQDVGSSWLMTSLAPSPVMVSLIQTAGNLPYFLLGLLAGTLADIADRRRLLIVSQLWMLGIGGVARHPYVASPHHPLDFARDEFFPWARFRARWTRSAGNRA